jgi:hypothetical protein
MAKKKAKGETKRGEPKKPKSIVSKELTEEEKARMAQHRERIARKPPKFKNVKGDSSNPTLALQDPEDPLLVVKMSETLGTPDCDLQGHLLNQAVQAFPGTVFTDGADNDKVAEAANKAMAALSGIQPRDEIEGMLAVQTIGVHNMAMEAMKLAMLGGQTFEGRRINVEYATKMLRTFVMQVEALRKYRTGGPQKMVVEHVNVSEGGQAIVGTVNQRVEKACAQNP